MPVSKITNHIIDTKAALSSVVLDTLCSERKEIHYGYVWNIDRDSRELSNVCKANINERLT